jgi:DNA repair protein RadD
MKLRAYQRAAIDGLYDYWSNKRGENPLIVAPTGSGKSLIIAQIVMDAMEYPDTRVMILTHVKELLEQNAAELIALKPSLEPDIGFYSAGLNRKQIDELITFAGIQSIWQRAKDMNNVPDLVIIDEAHLVPKKTATRYNSFIADLRERNPMVKIIGLTATPYRLDSGYLHHGEDAIFDGIAYDINIASLMDDGWLAPVISKAGIKSIDLSDVGMRGGEFIESELAIAASEPELIRMSVNEVVELGADRKSWLVFCSGVNHAQLVAREFLTYHDIECAVVTGTDGKEDRADKIERFKSGDIRCLINVNVLTTGFNAPAVDLVALMRATGSPGLYVQMVGRGTRTAPGKDDCLILDYGENVMRHGFIDKIKPRKPGTGTGDAPAKKCPECEHMMPTAVLVCPYCEYQFPPPEIKHAPEAYDGAMMSSQVVAEWLDVFMVAYARHRKKDKPDSIKITYTTDSMLAVSEWLCPDHGGYAADKYRQRMSVLGAVALTTEDALTDCETWKTPSRIKVKPDGNFFKIVQFDYSQRDNEPDPEWLEHAHLLQ